MTSDAGELYVVAWELHDSGFSVIPSGGGESGKQPLVPWTEYQTRQPTDEELHTWVDEYRPSLWGIVTGRLTDVFDCDTHAAAAPFESAGLKPHVRTPRGGYHYYFEAPSQIVKTVAGVLPGLDVRGNGGFVNVVGQNHAGDYKILTMPRPDNLYSWDQVPPEVAAALNNTRPPAPKDGVTRVTISEGQRNTTLTSLAGVMRRRGMEEAAIVAALLATNAAQCAPPLPESEVRAIAASVVRYPPEHGPVVPSNNVSTGWGGDIGSDKPIPSATRTKLGHLSVENLSELPNSDITGQVREWVSHTSGWWSNDELDKELGFTTLVQKDYRGKILRRLKEEGIVEQHQKSNRSWRYVNKAVTALDFKAASGGGILPLKWPMGIERYVNLFSGNLVVVAGSPNAGKTALLLNLVRLNQQGFPIYYFCSEMGSEELRNRLEQFPGMSIEDWKFDAKERASDFEDVVIPDCINIIDYLEMTDEIYRVNTHLTNMSHKIGTGLAIVALQKKVGAALGRGAEFSLEKPRLYLSMDRGKLTIVKGKSWANPKVDPNGLSVGFKIIKGCQFEVTCNWESK